MKYSVLCYTAQRPKFITKRHATKATGTDPEGGDRG